MKKEIKPQRYSKLAVWGFVLAAFIFIYNTLFWVEGLGWLTLYSFIPQLISKYVLGILFYPLITLSLIFSITGLIAIKRHKLKGKWMAVITIVLVILTILSPLIVITIASAFGQQGLLGF